MRIACIGNMNNMMFSLVRYLRDRGLEAELLTLDGEPGHFSPEADSYNDRYKGYTTKLGWSKKPSVLYYTSAQAIRDAVRKFDVFVVSDVAIAYLIKAGIRSDLFIPYGSDIHTIPHMKIWNAPFLKMHRYFHLRQMQRLGILNAANISLEETNPDFERQFVSRLKIRGRMINTTSPFVYYPQYFNGEMEEYKQRSSLFEKFIKIREKSDLLLFHHCRHEWNDDGSLEVSKHVWSKGNDILIKGLRRFVDGHGSVKTSLILFDYGTQVERSRRLVVKLGLEDNVHWFPQSMRKDIMMGISLADVGIGELAVSWYTYGAIVEFMSLGVPVVHNRDDSLYHSKRDNLYPMIGAHDETTICRALEEASDKGHAKDLGRRSREWFVSNLVDYPVNVYVNEVLQN